jgi:hypothetical protein
MWLADTNFPSEKNFEVATFNNDIFGKFSVRGNFPWVEMGLYKEPCSVDNMLLYLLQ